MGTLHKGYIEWDAHTLDANSTFVDHRLSENETKFHFRAAFNNLVLRGRVECRSGCLYLLGGKLEAVIPIWGSIPLHCGDLKVKLDEPQEIAINLPGLMGSRGSFTIWVNEPTSELLITYAVEPRWLGQLVSANLPIVALPRIESTDLPLPVEADIVDDPNVRRSQEMFRLFLNNYLEGEGGPKEKLKLVIDCPGTGPKAALASQVIPSVELTTFGIYFFPIFDMEGTLKIADRTLGAHLYARAPFGGHILLTQVFGSLKDASGVTTNVDMKIATGSVRLYLLNKDELHVDLDLNVSWVGRVQENIFLVKLPVA